MVIASLLLVACSDGTNPFDGGNGNGNGTTVAVPRRDADETITGDLASGATLDLAWASAAYCWPGNENTNFDGIHVFYERAQGFDRDVYVRVTPASGVDVSVYYAERTGTTQPPHLDANNTFDCDAAYDAAGDGNPGEAEVMLAPAPAVSAMNLLIGVAGANGAVAGAYTVEIWDEQGEVPDDAR